MDGIIFPDGETLSIPTGEFYFSPSGLAIQGMQTVYGTRLDRLKLLVERHGKMASLCEALGYARNDTAALTRILNENIRHERGQSKKYVMGDPMARSIEAKLGLPEGWMDTPVSYEPSPASVVTLTDPNDPVTKAAELMLAMEKSQQYQVLKVVAALAQPGGEETNPNGTNN